MQVLKKTYSKNGYTYTQVKRNDHAAMYEMRDGDRLVGYETGRIKTRAKETMMPNGVVLPAGERHWSDEDFGVMAWWCKDLDRANGYFEQMSLPPEPRSLGSGISGEIPGNV